MFFCKANLPCLKDCLIGLFAQTPGGCSGVHKGKSRKTWPVGQATKWLVFGSSLIDGNDVATFLGSLSSIPRRPQECFRRFLECEGSKFPKWDQFWY